MRLPLPLKRTLVVLFVVLSFVSQGTTSVLAGTTGAITGVVVDAASNQPVAAVKVTAASPSQTATTTTDGGGRFSFVSLAPDTYTVTVAAAGTHDAAVISGVTVQSDQNLNLTIAQPRKLTTIGSVTSRAASALVKPGTTADIYSINATTQDKASAFSGGGTLNSAWSAITSVPGVYVAPNRAGYIGAGSSVSIRGGDYNQIGYELDGIPVNRSFDNYPSNQLSSLGQQELQVYTGATPANSEANGISGYINQVIKSGTAPAYRTLDLGIGTPTMYNKFSFETGGANPSRTFSYYAGTGGYNQNYRYADQFNGASLSNLYGTPIVSCQTAYNSLTNKGANPAAYNASVVPSCFNPVTGADYRNGGAARSYVMGPYSLGSLATVRDRDNIVNLHFGIPQKSGSKDDIQLLWDYSHFSSIASNSANDQGGYGFLKAIGAPMPSYIDGYQSSLPLGSLLPTTYTGGGISNYLFPQSPTGRTLNSLLPSDFRDASSNDQSIVKLQYQKNFGTNAYLRAYVYTNYSDWLENSPISTVVNFAGSPSDYDVINHTRGVSLQFSDQLNTQHLLSIQGSYTTASSQRNNNTQMLNGLYGPNSYNARTIVGVLVDSSNPTNGICYTITGTAAKTCGFPAFAAGVTPTVPGAPGYPVGTGAFFTLGQALNGTVVEPAAGTICGGGPCQYLVGGDAQYATFNAVTPHFYSASITDAWTPTSKLNINLGLRFDRFQFVGQNTLDTAARAFWYAAYNRDNGTAIVNIPSQIEQYNEWQPRVGLTYTLTPTTVLRASYGRYAEAPNAAFEQYNYAQANDVASLATFGTFGLPTTPGHNVTPQVSNNYDLSLEKQVGRDLSFKLSPFYRKTNDQIQQFYLDQKTSFVSGLNVGRQTSQGVELEVDKGDFARNGFAGRLSFTYTNSYINYTALPNGSSIVDPFNSAIKAYNAFTKAGGGAPCYTRQTTVGGKVVPGVADPTCAAAGTVANPYYNAPLQALIDPSANFPTYSTFPGGVGGGGYGTYGAPYVATFLMQYKHGPLAITPALQFSAGQHYGVPESTPGIVPNTCTAVLTSPVASDPRYNYGAVGGNPYDATKCATSTATQSIFAIPNTYTGQFDPIGSFVRPSSLQLHLQASYDVSKTLSLVGNFANIINTCFGGSKEPWNVSGACSYGNLVGAGTGPLPFGNVYNPGWSMQPFMTTPYDPGFAGFPFQFYLEARLKL